jgi:hypothetical protein
MDFFSKYRIISNCRRRKSKSDVSPTAFRELNFDPILNDSEFVSMLVPNPVEGQEWKTRIGHKDVDEVSGNETFVLRLLLQRPYF